ncbi:MAG: radical SAM protein [Acidobacteria bacterium]|nr:radical SAM protein [Acidobacteriota bacterium]
MKVLLLSVRTERMAVPVLPVGLGMVAAAARRAGHTVELLDLVPGTPPAAQVGAAVARLRPDAIGVSVRNIDDQNMQAPRFLLSAAQPVIAACRACSAAPIVLGGAGYSIFPGSALVWLGADYGIRGDGEAAFTRLLACLAAGREPARIPGLHVRAAGAATAPRFDSEPGAGTWPVPETWGAAACGDPELLVPVQTRRGCGFDCSYCSTASIEGRRVRTRPIASVLAHLRGLAEAGLRRVYFVDSVFNEPRDYALELCRRVAAERLPLAWRCILYPHRIDAELVRAMAAAGCDEVSLGFESGSREILRNMNKRFGPEDVRNASEVTAAFGLRRNGFLLLGGPGETLDSVAESRSLADSLRLDTLKVTLGVRIYPGTPLADTALREGLVGPADDLLQPRFYLAPTLRPHLPELQQLASC